MSCYGGAFRTLESLSAAAGRRSGAKGFQTKRSLNYWATCYAYKKKAEAGDPVGSYCQARAESASSSRFGLL